MKSINSDKQHILRLEKGEELVECILEYVKENSIRACWVTGLGGLSEATLGFYDLNSMEYQWTSFIEPLELASLTGNVFIVKAEPKAHLHATISAVDMHAKAGHLKSAITAGTVELYLTELEVDISRYKDPNTGLNLLDL